MRTVQLRCKSDDILYISLPTSHLFIHSIHSPSPIQLAAIRLAKYWKKRIKIFGPHAFDHNLTLNGALREDKVALDIAFFRQLPGTDKQGRAILYGQPCRLDKSKYTRESMERVVWYMLHALLEDETVQKKGVVFVLDLKGAELRHFDIKMVKSCTASIKGVMPLRVSAIHFCRAPMMFDLLAGTIHWVLGEVLRKRIKNHSHWRNCINDVDSLGQYGIDSRIIPVDLGGSATLDHESWLKNREYVERLREYSYIIERNIIPAAALAPLGADETLDQDLCLTTKEPLRHFNLVGTNESGRISFKCIPTLDQDLCLLTPAPKEPLRHSFNVVGTNESGCVSFKCIPDIPTLDQDLCLTSKDPLRHFNLVGTNEESGCISFKCIPTPTLDPNSCLKTKEPLRHFNLVGTNEVSGCISFNYIPVNSISSITSTGSPTSSAH